MDEEMRKAGTDYVLAVWSEWMELKLMPALLIAREAKPDGGYHVLPGGPGMPQEMSADLLARLARQLKEGSHA